MTITRPETNSEYNEHIPKHTVANVAGHHYKNILNVTKINPNSDWNGDVKNLSYNVQVDWSYRPSQGSYFQSNHYDGKFS